MKRLLTTVAVGLVGIQGVALATETRPKLVVGIVVDQLRTDYLENLRDMFGAGGFRRLMDNALYLKDVEFDALPGDAASSTAVIMTGDYPRYNGVTGSNIYDPTIKGMRPTFQDESFIGNFTNETYSPEALRVTTLSDEVTIEDRGKTRVHSIAPDAAQAIILAGHTGNSAFWLNEESGRWSSTTYYQNPPAMLQNRNYERPLISMLDTIKWLPLKLKEPYPFVKDEDINEGFKYNFSRSDKDVFSLYKTTPFINEDITEAATEYIMSLGLGKNEEGTDILNLGYTLAPYPARTKDDYRYELEDSYLRLDKDLEKLFGVIDKEVGQDSVLVYLVSTGYFVEPPADNFKYRVPGGTFSVKRALSLLNAYLAAKYGNGSYVDHFAGNHLYLSLSTLEEKNLDLDKIAQESRDFLVRMSGVADAFTMGDLMSPALPELEAIRLATDPKSSGDVVLKFNPGWKVVDDSRYPSVELINKTTAYKAPGFLLGPDIRHQVVETPVEAIAIAPTVANVLKIRPPNSVASKPLNIN